MFTHKNIPLSIIIAYMLDFFFSPRAQGTFVSATSQEKGVVAINRTVATGEGGGRRSSTLFAVSSAENDYNDCVHTVVPSGWPIEQERARISVF